MKRHLFNKLLAWKNENNRKPLILKGVRQVGKTYLLKEFGRLQFPKCHYFNFEKQPNLGKIFEYDLSPQRILNELSVITQTPICLATDLLIFDEIQEVPKALTSLKYFQEECSELYLCCAGSLLGLHLNSTSFPVGKVSFETLYPMSFTEFLAAIDPFALSSLSQNTPISETIHNHLWTFLKQYLIVGGLPEAVACYIEYKDTPLEAFSRVRKKQDDLLNTYYADIAKHAGKVNAMHIDRVLRSIPKQLQQTHDGSIARFKFKDVIPGVSHYERLASAIDWLESAGLAIKVHIVNTGNFPFAGYAKENFFKLLLFDIGILGCMTDLTPKQILQAEYGSYKGFFAENFVAQEFLSLGEAKLYSWQEQTAEIEFLLNLDGHAIPVEVKSGTSVKAKSLQIFTNKYHPPKKIVLSAKAPLFDTQHQTEHYPLYAISKFLQPRNGSL